MKKLLLACAIGISVIALATTRDQQVSNKSAGFDVQNFQDTIPGKKDTAKLPWPDTTKRPVPPIN